MTRRYTTMLMVFLWMPLFSCARHSHRSFIAEYEESPAPGTTTDIQVIADGPRFHVVRRTGNVETRLAFDGKELRVGGPPEVNAALALIPSTVETGAKKIVEDTSRFWEPPPALTQAAAQPGERIAGRPTL